MRACTVSSYDLPVIRPIFSNILPRQAIEALKYLLNIFCLYWGLTSQLTFFSHVGMEPQLPGPEVIKLFSSSAQLSMKFQLLINAKIVKISGKYRFIPQNLVIYPANKC